MSSPGRSPLGVACLALSFVAASIWFAVGLGDSPDAAWLAAKAAAVPLLALYVALARPRPAAAGWVAAALAAHGGGDLLLELSLLAGVAAFFLGHLLYVAAFWRQRRTLDEIGGGTKAGAGTVGLFAAGFLAYLTPRLDGPLAFAIPLYVAALAAMCAAAWWTRPGRPWVPLGATLFVLSDALLGLELFAGGIPGGRSLVWPLYVAGQLAIATGWARSGAEGHDARRARPE